MPVLIDIPSTSTRIAAVPGETVLAAALRAGIDYPHSCQEGRCGACRSRLLAGEVDLLPHSRFALAPAERESGLILACRAVPQSDLRVAWLNDTEQLRATVVARHEVAAGIVRVVVESGHGTALSFRPGQYFDVGFPGAPARSFSPANQSGTPQLEFHIRPLPSGKAGEIVQRHLKEGDTVTLDGPFGDAYMRESEDRPLLAMAAGSGLAPIKAIVDRAIEISPHRETHLYVSARSADQLYLVGYFRDLAARIPSFRFETVVTGKRPGVLVRRLPDIIAERYDTLEGWVAHTAGPPGFVEAVSAAVVGKGLRPADLLADPFFQSTAIDNSIGPP